MQRDESEVVKRWIYLPVTQLSAVGEFFKYFDSRTCNKKYTADRSVNRRRINGSTGHFFFPNRNFTNWRLLRNSYHMSPDFSASDGVKFFLQGSGLKDRCYEPQWRAGGRMLQGVQDSSLRWLSLYLGNDDFWLDEIGKERV
ncbi:hypothetical protein C8J57DRAFT_1235095 [Mycena rebaudengoi]|nr:hypothetical protein C8J57DRAFT_1235095 [Mycena rebaudengoi]